MTEGSARRSAEELAALMASSADSPGQQLRQTRFRVALVGDWRIPEGSRVLEIGCGQGDTTAVLADAVGSHGRVIAVDLAEPGYGAPVTVGDSAQHLSSGPLGARIKFRYGFDVLDPENAFPDDAFDAIVLAHCTWYFGSLDQLRETLRL
jgi:SAM-dependent methyltransferase